MTCEETCIKITRNDCDEVGSLKNTHEEADTRLLLHAKHAAPKLESIVIVAENTDVLMLNLAFNKQRNKHQYVHQMWHTNQDNIH